MSATAPSSPPVDEQPTLIAVMLDQVAAAAVPFESRWTMRALARVDVELHQAVEEQHQLFHEAIMGGESGQLREHGEAMCRGWAAAAARMDRAGEPDDAYFIGQDSRTGLRVAIGDQRAAATRVRDLHDERVVWLTPDEVAAMFAGLQGVAQVKALWPDSEITEVRPKRVDLYADHAAREDL